MARPSVVFAAGFLTAAILGSGAYLVTSQGHQSQVIEESSSSQFEQDVTFAMDNPVANPRSALLPRQMFVSVMNWESRDRYEWTDPELGRQLWIDVPKWAQVTEMNTIPDGRVLSCYSGDIFPPAPKCTNGLAILVGAWVYDENNK